MPKTFVIAMKEIKTFFSTPIAYVVTMVYLGLSGYFFSESLHTAFPLASVAPYLTNSLFLLILLSPILTMRLFAEEQKLGTIELLLTSPIRDWEIVVGKFLGALVFFSFAIFFTLYFYFVMEIYGSPDPGPAFSAYLGFILHGASTLAIGLLASSLTSNQIVSAVIAFGIIFLLSLIDQLGSFLGGFASTLVTELALTTHFEDFARGIIDFKDLVFYLSLISFCLFTTTRILEIRRWRG